MPEQDYSKREVDAFIKNMNASTESLKNYIDEKIDVFESNTSTALEEIRKQTTKTNGSVANLSKFKEQAVGSLKTLGIVGVVFLALLSWALYQINQNQNQISVLNEQVSQLNNK